MMGMCHDLESEPRCEESGYQKAGNVASDLETNLFSSPCLVILTNFWNSILEDK